MASNRDLGPELGLVLADRYRLERELGSGGMASVFLAEDLRHHRKIFTAIFMAIILLLAAMLQVYRRAAFGSWKRPDGSLLIGRHRREDED